MFIYNNLKKLGSHKSSDESEISEDDMGLKRSATQTFLHNLTSLWEKGIKDTSNEDINLNNYSLFMFDKNNLLRNFATFLIRNKYFKKARILIILLISMSFAIDTFFFDEYDRINDEDYEKIAHVIQIILFSFLLFEIMLTIISDGMVFESQAFFQTGKNAFLFTTTFSFFLKFHFEKDKDSFFMV